MRERWENIVTDVDILVETKSRKYISELVTTYSNGRTLWRLISDT